MIIRKVKQFSLFLLLMACGDNMVDDPIPIVGFADIVIDTSFPEYVALRTTGGFKTIGGGVRGIILYRSGPSSFRAFERNCSYHPNEACATVNVHSSGIFMNDPCCGSDFSFQDGSPTGGVAWQPLRIYRTQFNGNTVTISDEIVN